MRTKILISSMLLAFSFLSCQNENNDSTDKLENKIKRKLQYNFIEDKTPLWISEYQYDNEAKLEKIFQYSGIDTNKAYEYELFEYDSNNKTRNRLTFHYANDSIGWILHDSTHYSYENGKLIKEEISYFTISSDHIIYKYKYENSNLIKKYKYNNQQLENYIIYDYSGSLCIKETTYKDSLGINLYDYTIHYYEDGILSKSEKYSSNNNKKQIISYTYDNKGNLIIEESKQVDFSIDKPLYYVIRYEYY